MHMDLKNNHGGGFSISQEAEFQFMGSWIPPTPEKSVPRRSNLMPVRRDESQMSRTNWQELPAFPNGFPQGVFNLPNHFWQIDDQVRQGQYSFQNTNIETGIGGSIVEEGRQNEHSFLRDLLEPSSICNCIDSSVNRMVTRNASFISRNCSFIENISTEGLPMSPILQPELNNYREASSRGLHATKHSNSNQLRSQHFSPHLYPYYVDELPLPSHPCYNLNLPPRTTEDTKFNSLQFPPVTPDKTRIWEINSGSTVNTSAEKCSREERNTHHDFVITGQVKESNFGELLHHTGDSSSTVLASPSAEPKESDVGIFQGIDLNKTPQMKPPKRKKHRPKVIIEGKPKRTPKPTTKASDSKETPTGKGKHVHKMSLNKSATAQTASAEQTLTATGNTEVVNVPSSGRANGKRKYVCKKQGSETQNKCSVGVNFNIGNTEPAQCDTEPNTPPTGKRKYECNGLEESNQPSILDTAKSCRRALKFDLLNPRDQHHNTNIQQQEMADKDRVVLNFNACPEATGTSNVAKNKMHGTMSVLQNRLHEQSRQIDTLSSCNPCMYQKTNGNVAISERQPAEAHRGPTKIQMENLNVNITYKNTKVTQHILEQIVFPDRTSYEEVFQNLKSQNNAQSINYSICGNESKRGHCPMEQRNPYVADVVSPLLSQKVFMTDYRHQKCSNISQNQIVSKMQASACIMTTHNAAIKDPIQGKIRISDVNSSGFSSKYSCGPWETHSLTNNINKSCQKYTADRNIHLTAGYNAPKMADGSSTVIGVLNGDKLPQVSIQTGSNSAGQIRLKACRNDISRDQQIMEYPLCNLGPSEKGTMQQDENTVKDRKPVKRRGRPSKHRFSSVEDITNQMGSLNLNGKEHSALVLYNSGGDIVSYDGFEFLKKHKPRPKVDLDPETERVWKLLMWQEGHEGIEGTNEETEKRWEEERRIFRGRVDSFIARMHLIQGDRSFSKWKGSVVDSVIGVFLTQNVSDHLSSSAFMNLAARFPLKPGKNTSSRNAISILVEEPVASILNPDTSIKSHEMPSGNITEHQRENNFSLMERMSNREVHCQSLEEKVLSSQESFGSSVIQVNGIASSSGSNSEVEDSVTGCRPNGKHGSYLDLEEFYNYIGENSIFERGSRHRHQPVEDLENQRQWQKMGTLDSMKGLSTSNMQINYANSLMQPQAVPSNHRLHANAQFGRHVERFESFAEESILSWPSATSRFVIERDVCCPDKRIGHWEETSCHTPVQNLGPIKNQEPPVSAPDAVVSKHSACVHSNFKSHKNTHERNKIFQRENNIITEPPNLPESLTFSQNASRKGTSNVSKFTGEVFDAENSSALLDKPTTLGHILTQPNSTQKVHSVDKGNTQPNANISKRRKRKAESDDRNAGNWESLRLLVELNGRRKERSKETEDSLDYEALRCATVKEISETIKERGMNNMLAERIKEFLDRLIMDHGSIDLEWLRDAPPEEAKKYLLSIRGLGLKSVECVRLLTLHHLAFPVDTNVGRIAVRLGWVPLRPLPESLQLHLLELYPILESIQKYLWPRLCRLDQRTLYELHYQLITFGKVFCTKSKPNCNACPLRAECRHFASAFASVRLTLPGPEDKSTMPTTVPFTTENSGIVINPMPLPSLEDNIISRAGPVFGSCVPIVEEPSSPEQHIEVVESDIEDTFREDPNEIPTIKLNMQEFTENLHNYAQSNMELQEVDTSKALAILHPGAAPIPTRKLKNVSRLRTEHQVYELPDSHPLLKEMDAREPDDPSPYLLAIWTPGETPTSIQPPEQQCQFQGTSKLCNEETCFSCNSIKEVNSLTVRGTILIPCRTAMRGSFPLNGTYFQVNEVFADHESSINPINVPRAWIWNLPRRIVYFGTSVSTIFKGLTTEGIQFCFWKGFVCVRGFEQKTRAPRPLIARLHFPASRLARNNTQARHTNNQTSNK